MSASKIELLNEFTAFADGPGVRIVEADDKPAPKTPEEKAKDTKAAFVKLADEYLRWLEMALALPNQSERYRKARELLAEFASKVRGMDLPTLAPSDKPDAAQEQVTRMLRDANLDGAIGKATVNIIVEHVRRGEYREANAIVRDYAKLGGGRQKPFAHDDDFNADEFMSRLTGSAK